MLLTDLPPLINNLITPPQPNTSLLQAMGQEAASQPDFSATLSGQQQLATLMQNDQTLANQARSDARSDGQLYHTDAGRGVAGSSCQFQKRERSIFSAEAQSPSTASLSTPLVGSEMALGYPGGERPSLRSPTSVRARPTGSSTVDSSKY